MNGNIYLLYACDEWKSRNGRNLISVCSDFEKLRENLTEYLEGVNDALKAKINLETMPRTEDDLLDYVNGNPNTYAFLGVAYDGNLELEW